MTEGRGEGAQANFERESAARDPTKSYREGFACRDDEPLQGFLNDLYEYENDWATKVLHRCRLNLFVRILRDLATQQEPRSLGSALDIGCNAGMYSRILSDLGYRHVTGIDIVPEMIEKANTHFGSDAPDRRIEFRLQSAEELDRSRRFDLILCTEVIEHTADPDRVIESIRAMVAPGGLAVVSLPNRISFPYAMERIAYRLKRGPRNLDFERHLEYPFHRTMKLFTDGERRLLRTDGTNLFWTDRLLRAVYPTPVFPLLNRVNFELARWWPLKYLSQFFYVVVRRG